MEYQETEEFLIKKLRKYIEGYVYDADLSSSECLKVIVEIVPIPSVRRKILMIFEKKKRYIPQYLLI